MCNHRDNTFTCVNPQSNGPINENHPFFFSFVHSSEQKITIDHSINWHAHCQYTQITIDSHWQEYLYISIRSAFAKFFCLSCWLVVISIDTHNSLNINRITIIALHAFVFYHFLSYYDQFSFVSLLIIWHSSFLRCATVNGFHLSIIQMISILLEYLQCRYN
jgi:hypothetical protein